jgi:hypothetical protein
MVKSFTIIASFPQALAKHHTQSVTVEANGFPLAIKRGLQALMKRPGLKGLRHQVVEVKAIAHVPPRRTP